MASLSGDESGSGAEGNVLVIGAGVSGLTSALCLRQKGFEVTVVADQFAPRVTSVVAGALWEWPPAVCGHHHDQVSLDRSKIWCHQSYEIFADLARDPLTGVFLRPVTFYVQHPICADERLQRKVDELRSKVREFKHDSSLIRDNGVNPRLGFQDAYSYLAPMIDTDAYMHWLLGEAQKAGCQIIESQVTGNLRQQESSLANRYGVEAIVNCTGLGASELTGDLVSPLRGALIRLRNDGKTLPRMTQAHCVSQDGSGEDRGFIFIVPRGEDILLLGGLAEPDERDLEIGLHNYEPIREMYQRCLEFLPILSGATIDAAEPVRVGLRPVRLQNVRLERELGTRIVHNYGHGGSGVTFSWGCSFEVAERVADLLAEGE